jgi:hypothetical protein
VRVRPDCRSLRHVGVGPIGTGLAGGVDEALIYGSIEQGRPCAVGGFWACRISAVAFHESTMNAMSEGADDFSHALRGGGHEVTFMPNHEAAQKCQTLKDTGERVVPLSVEPDDVMATSTITLGNLFARSCWTRVSSSTTNSSRSRRLTVLSQVNGFPLLTVGDYGQGRSAAFASDIGPHWAPRTFTRWDGFAQLWTQTISWLAGEDSATSPGNARATVNERMP